MTKDHTKQQTNPALIDSILTAHELAAFLKLTEATVYKLVASGELPGYKIGGSWRFDTDEVLEWIAAGTSTAKTAALEDLK